MTKTLGAYDEQLAAALKGHPGNPGTGVYVVYLHGSPIESLVIQAPSCGVTGGTFTTLKAFSPVGGVLTAGDRFELPDLTSWITLHATCGNATAPPLQEHLSLSASTDAVFGLDPLVRSKFDEAAASAEQEWFEDGVESAFARTLSLLLHAYGFSAITAAETFLNSPTSNVEIAVETAQWLGAVDHPASRHYRKTILEHLLGSPSPRIRHGAAAGLAALNEPTTLSAIRRALDQEGNRRLRAYLGLVVEQLERTRACRNS